MNDMNKRMLKSEDTQEQLKGMIAIWIEHTHWLLQGSLMMFIYLNNALYHYYYLSYLKILDKHIYIIQTQGIIPIWVDNFNLLIWINSSQKKLYSFIHYFLCIQSFKSIHWPLWRVYFTLLSVSLQSQKQLVLNPGSTAWQQYDLEKMTKSSKCLFIQV